MPKGLDDLFFANSRPRIRSFDAPLRLDRQLAHQHGADPGPVSSGLSILAAREQVENSVTQFILSALPGEALLVAAPPGLGKTRAAMAAVRRSGKKALVLSGTTQLAREVATKHGLSRIEPRSDVNCLDMTSVGYATRAGLSVASAVCGTPQVPICFQRQSCPYFQQFHDDVAVAPTEQLFNTLAVQGRKIVILDDAELRRALMTTTTVKLQDLATDRDDEEFPDSLKILCDVITRASKIPMEATTSPWDLLAFGAAATGTNLIDLLRDIEQAVPRWDAAWDPPTSGPSELEERLRRMPAGGLRALVQALLEEMPSFESGLDFNCRFRFVPAGIEVASLRELPVDKNGNSLLAKAAFLVLDATPVESLVAHLFRGLSRRPDHRLDVTMPAEVRVIQDARFPWSLSAVKRGDKGFLEQTGTVLEKHPTPPALVGIVTHKDLTEPRLKETAAKILTFGSARGSNKMEAVRLLFVIGRFMSPGDSIHFEAQVIHHDEDYVRPGTRLAYRSYGGHPIAVEVIEGVDSRITALRRAISDDELIQVVHRARPYSIGTKEDDRPALTIVLLTNHPVPLLGIDELILPESPGLSANGVRHKDAYVRIEEAHECLVRAGIVVNISSLATAAHSSRNTVKNWGKEKFGHQWPRA